MKPYQTAVHSRGVLIGKGEVKSMSDKFIPLSVPSFEGNERKYVNDALDQGWVSTGGAYITELENRLADFLHVPECVACQSGTSALHLSLVQAGVQPGDVVLVPPVTFIAAVNPVKYQFATPIFIDCDDSLCMDPVKLKAFCEEECEFIGGVLNYKGAVVKAIIVVHVFGNMVDMESIMDIASKYHFFVIEDATEALGTKYTEGRYKDKFAGTIGDFGTFSFNGNKIITTGGGGAVVSNHPAGLAHIRYLSTQAKDDPYFYIHNEVGYNYRMTNLQAALGVAQMEELPEFIKRKQNNYKLYQELLQNFKLAELMPFRRGTFSNKWLYSIRIDSDRVQNSLRDIVAVFRNRNIGTRPIWGLVNEQLPYRNNVNYKMEKAPYYAARILNIPSSTNLTEDDIRYVTVQIKELLKQLAEK